MVVEIRRPACNHVFDSFAYSIGLLEHIEMSDFEQWPAMQFSLNAYIT